MDAEVPRCHIHPDRDAVGELHDHPACRECIEAHLKYGYDLTTLSGRMKHARATSGLTQEQTAEQSGVSIEWVKAAERGAFDEDAHQLAEQRRLLREG